MLVNDSAIITHDNVNNMLKLQSINKIHKEKIWNIKNVVYVKNQPMK